MADIEVPKKGVAGVCVNEGPDFRVEVQEVDVPEPSQLTYGAMELRQLLILKFFR